MTDSKLSAVWNDAPALRAHILETFDTFLFFGGSQRQKERYVFMAAQLAHLTGTSIEAVTLSLQEELFS